MFLAVFIFTILLSHTQDITAPSSVSPTVVSLPIVCEDLTYAQLNQCTKENGCALDEDECVALGEADPPKTAEASSEGKPIKCEDLPLTSCLTQAGCVVDQSEGECADAPEAAAGETAEAGEPVEAGDAAEDAAKAAARAAEAEKERQEEAAEAAEEAAEAAQKNSGTGESGEPAEAGEAPEMGEAPEAGEAGEAASELAGETAETHSEIAENAVEFHSEMAENSAELTEGMVDNQFRFTDNAGGAGVVPVLQKPKQVVVDPEEAMENQMEAQEEQQERAEEAAEFAAENPGVSAGSNSAVPNSEAAEEAAEASQEQAEAASEQAEEAAEAAAESAAAAGSSATVPNSEVAEEAAEASQEQAEIAAEQAEEAAEAAAESGIGGTVVAPATGNTDANTATGADTTASGTADAGSESSSAGTAGSESGSAGTTDSGTADAGSESGSGSDTTAGSTSGANSGLPALPNFLTTPKICQTVTTPEDCVGPSVAPDGEMPEFGEHPEWVCQWNTFTNSCVSMKFRHAMAGTIVAAGGGSANANPATGIIPAMGAAIEAEDYCPSILDPTKCVGMCRWIPYRNQCREIDLARSQMKPEDQSEPAQSFKVTPTQVLIGGLAFLLSVALGACIGIQYKHRSSSQLASVPLNRYVDVDSYNRV